MMIFQTTAFMSPDLPPDVAKAAAILQNYLKETRNASLYSAPKDVQDAALQILKYARENNNEAGQYVISIIPGKNTSEKISNILACNSPGNVNKNDPGMLFALMSGGMNQFAAKNKLAPGQV
jgi:hypothetical protein